MIEVDLLDADGGITSIFAVDETFWSQYGAQATAYAAQNGLGVYASTSAPVAGTAERNVSAWGDWTNGVASAGVGLKLKPAGWSTGKTVAVIGASVAGVGLIGYLAWRLLL